MKNHLINAIETYFTGLDENGDFVRYGDSGPYQLIVPKSALAPVIYTTKPNLFFCCDSNDASFGLIGRYGLPREIHLEFMERFIGNRDVWYIGDLDPPDLLVYAWLRLQLQQTSIMHRGVNDRFISRLVYPLPESHIIACSEREARAIESLPAILPDYRELLGAGCASLVDGGKKVELDAIQSIIGPSKSLASLIVE